MNCEQKLRNFIREQKKEEHGGENKQFECFAHRSITPSHHNLNSIEVSELALHRQILSLRSAEHQQSIHISSTSISRGSASASASASANTIHIHIHISIHSSIHMTSCSICYEDQALNQAGDGSSNSLHSLKNCNHKFCHSCLTKWLKQYETGATAQASCPACRASIDIKDAESILGRPLMRPNTSSDSNSSNIMYRAGSDPNLFGTYADFDVVVVTDDNQDEEEEDSTTDEAQVMTDDSFIQRFIQARYRPSPVTSSSSDDDDNYDHGDFVYEGHGASANALSFGRS